MPDSRGYDLPPELERRLLDYFGGSPRPVPFQFTTYPLDVFSRVRELGTTGNLEEAWDQFNDRRAFLIDKELSEGLSDEEASELQRLRTRPIAIWIRLSDSTQDLSGLEDRVRNG